MRTKLLSIFISAVIVTAIFPPIIQSLGQQNVLSSGTGGPANSPWPMFRQNLNHTGVSPHDTSANPGKLKWSFTTSCDVYSSPAIGSDGTIYIGSYDNKLYAIYPDGTQKWNFMTGDEVKTSPTIGSDGTIYIGSDDFKLYAINPDGTQKWNFTTGHDLGQSSPAIGSDGTIYVGSFDNKLYAINPDGTERWSFTAGGLVGSSPAIGSDGTIYVGSWDCKLYAINPDGTQKWNFTTGHFVWSSPAIGSDGTIYVGSDDNKLYAINPDGTQKWSFTAGDDVDSSPAVGSDGTIYVGSDDFNLYAINPNGTKKWSFATGFNVHSSPAIGSDGTIYIGSFDNKLYAINSDGTQKWNFTTGSYVLSSPAIGSDGTIYVGSCDDRLYAIGTPSQTQPPVADAGPDQIVNEGDTVQFDGTSSTGTGTGVINILHVSIWMQNELQKIIDYTGSTDKFLVTQIGLSEFNAGTPSDLSLFDTIVFGLSDAFENRLEPIGRTEELKNYVEFGGGIVWTADSLEFTWDYGSDLEDPAGVDFDSNLTQLVGLYIQDVEIIMDHDILHNFFKIGDEGDIITKTPYSPTRHSYAHTTYSRATTADIIMNHNITPASTNFYLTTHEYGQGRVVVDVIGHSVVSWNGTLLGIPYLEESQILVNSIYWAADGTNSSNILSYEWDFDASNGLWWETGAPPDATGPTPTYIYGDNGVYTVTLRVTDDSGADDTDTCIVTVNNVAPKVEPITAHGTTAVQQDFTEEWVARYDGLGNGLDIAYAVAVDSSGNVYVTGRSRGSGTDDDYATVAYDSLGNELWVVRYNGPGNEDDWPKAITLDSKGNVYVTGHSQGSMTSWDYATIKYDSLGNELWVARYNGPAGNGVDDAQAIVVDASGNIYVTGGSSETGTDIDYATIKYDPDGNELWVARYDGRPEDSGGFARDIALDSSGNIYVTGYGEGDGTDLDYVTIKYDPDGNELWVSRYGGLGFHNDYANDMVMDQFGNVYVTGKSSDIDVSPVTDQHYDYTTIAYDTYGNQLWVVSYNGPGNGFENARAIATDLNGNVYVTGGSEGNGTKTDYATIAYDSLGNQLWVARYNGPGNGHDYARAIAVDSVGNVYVTGQSRGNGTDYDVATIAYDSSGNKLWVARYNSPGNYSEEGLAIATDSSQKVYVTGWSNWDYATIKYHPSTFYECDEGSPIILSANASDPGSDDLTFTWDWGDGTPDTVTTHYNNGIGPEPVYNPATNEIKSPWGTYPFTTTDTVSHTYGDNGLYTITITVEDDDGGTTIITTNVTVRNVAPTLDSNGPYSGNEGSPITFASIATDPGSDDLTFTWNWGDGTSPTTTTYYNDGIGPDPYPSPLGTYPFTAVDTVQHTYGDNGVYNVTVTVEDDDGGTAVVTSTVTVYNIAPTITMVIAPSGDEGSSLTFEAEATDPGSDDLTFSWEFEYGPTISHTFYNNGLSSDPSQSPLGTYPFSASDTVTYTYGDDYKYTLDLRVEDDDGGVALYSTIISVNNIAPSITEIIIPNPAEEGIESTFRATAKDEGSDDLTFEWDFGDLTSMITNSHYNDGINPDPYPSPAGLYPFSAQDTVNYTYGDNYNYTLILKVTDDDGGMTTFSTVVLVNNIDPIIEPFGPFTIDEGSPLDITVTCTDSGSDDLTFIWEFEFGPTITNVHYNDGADPDPYPSPWGTFPFSVADIAEHTYGDNGMYTLTLIVEDDDGGSTVYITNITVNNVAPIVDALSNATIDESGTVDFPGHATDPGSDDLTFTWDWGYAGFSDTVKTYLNNPPGSDLYPSPELNPRDVTDIASQAYGDNGVFIITLTATDDDGGATTVTTTVTVDNVAPQIVNIEAYMYVNFTLRVAGEKWHSVQLTLYENDDEIWNARVTRQPGSPDEQAAFLTDYSIDMENSYKAIVDYLPNDPRENGNVWGGNPVWIILEFQHGTSERLHHTFNVRKSYWDSDHWNHIDPWEVNLTGIISRHNITFKATATDPGSDDLIFAWDFDDGGTAGPNPYYNNGVSPDPYPSPEVNQMNVTDTVTYAYGASGLYTVTLTVMDDDGGITSTTLVMLIG